MTTAAERAAASARFEHLTVEQGLSDNWVLSVLEDHRGFMWFGTRRGLDRWDGRGFRTYRHDPDDPTSLPASLARVLFEDSKKRLWVGSGFSNCGFALYDREHDSFTRFLPRPELRGHPAGNNVRVIVEGPQGLLWLGTDNGVARFDPETRTTRLFPLSAQTREAVLHDSVDSLLFDRKGRLWVGTGAGLMRLDPVSGRYSSWGGKGEASGLQRREIWDIYEDERGSLWIAVLGDGVHRLDPETGRDVRFLADPADPGSVGYARVKRVVPDGHGHLYVGTENGGVCLLDMHSGSFTRFLPDAEDDSALNSASVWSLLLDAQGILWIGTYDGGVNVLSPQAQRFRLTKPRSGQLRSSHVSALLEDRSGNLWVGTDGGGLHRIDARTGRFTYYTHDARDPETLGSDSVWALLEDSHGDIWIGGWDAGLARLDPASGRVRRFRHDPRDPVSLASDHVWRILELRSGELLVGTQTGADLLDRKTGRFTHLVSLCPELTRNAVYGAAEDARGNLWLVGNTVVNYLDRARMKARRYRNDPADPQSLGSGWTQAVRIDHAGNVWLGTEGGLCCVSAKDGSLRRYTLADGLPSETVNAIEEDAAGDLWIGTKSGLTRMSDAAAVPDEPELLSFDVRDGLQSTEWARNACLRRRNGEMLFGGRRGLNSFDPRRIRRDLTAPPVVFTELRIANAPVRPSAGGRLLRSITETSDLVLSHEDSMVTIEFAALSFALPQKNQYAYRLEGLDDRWNALGTQRAVTFTSLPPGSYVLHVRASNGDGVWNEEGARLRIVVTPPWWATWWFRSLLAGVALALAATTARRISTRRMRRDLERLERQRAVERDRARIARDIHDDLGAGLTQISLLSELVCGDGPEEARGHVEQIAETARELTRAMDEIVWAVNPTGDTLKSLWDYLSHYAQDYLSAADMHCRVDSPEPVPAMSVPAEVRHNVFLAAKEALNNAVKHSGGQEVRLRLVSGDRRFEVHIEDDGCGLPGSTAAAGARPFSGQGLRNLEQRMSAIGASCEISAGSLGTRIRLVVSLG